MTDTPQKPEPVAAPDSFEIAAAAAWDFIWPKLIPLKKEKGLAGVWSNGFRSGWDAKAREAEAMNRRPTPTSADNARVAQEPVAWQRRLRHVHDDRWTEWKDCSKEQADFAAANGRPEHFREHLRAEVRPLYTQDQLDAAVRAERERILSHIDGLLETLQEGLMTDAGLSKLDRQKMRAQIDALDVVAAAIREGE